MKIPGSEKAFVEDAKLGYLLLSEEKGGFFGAIGFTVGEDGLLRQALLRHIGGSEVSRVVETEFGVKYIVDGRLESPDGRKPEVRSVWIREVGSNGPRFLTAYPQRRRKP